MKRHNNRVPSTSIDGPLRRQGAVEGLFRVIVGVGQKLLWGIGDSLLVHIYNINGYLVVVVTITKDFGSLTSESTESVFRQTNPRNSRGDDENNPFRMDLIERTMASRHGTEAARSSTLRRRQSPSKGLLRLHPLHCPYTSLCWFSKRLLFPTFLLLGRW